MLRTTFKLACCALFLLGSLAARADAFYSRPLDVREFPIGHLLTWETATEIEVANFVVEKSIDGRNFFELGSVNGAGFSMLDKSYRFMDVGAMEAKNFYRLREVGSDGTVFFTMPIILEKKLPNVMRMLSMTSPEVKKEFRLTLDLTKDAKLDCTLANFGGKPIQKFSHTATSGVNDVVFNLENLEPGIYQLKVRHGDEVESLVLRRVADEQTSRPQVASRKKTGNRGNR